MTTHRRVHFSIKAYMYIYQDHVNCNSIHKYGRPIRPLLLLYNISRGIEASVWYLHNARSHEGNEKNATAR